MTEATATEAKPKARKRTAYEDAGVGKLRQPGDGDLPYLNDKGRFLIGHDAKLKRDLINMVLGGKDAPKVKGVANAQKAEELLATLRWTSHLDASRKAREGKAAKAAARAEAKATAAANQPSAERVETAKANKATAEAFVDNAVRVTVDGTPDRLGKVIRVFRSDEDDILSPWMAQVLVPDNPQDPDSETQSVEVPVADLKTA